jgi:hypothetical protein
MEAGPRITIRNLLNTFANIVSAPELRDDEWARSYYLSLAVIKHFLGAEWAEEHLKPDAGARGFLQPDLGATNLQVQFFRAIDLAELLFNLQHIEGFDGCLTRLHGGDIEPTLAELDVARMLHVNDQMFWFVEPQGKTGNDYDMRVVLPGLRLANIETKCNIETPDVNIKTISNSLNKARKQLPPKQAGIIFVKIPPQWLNEPSFAQQTGRLALDFMRGTDRVVSVKYYAAPMFFENGRIGQGHRFLEITSPKRRSENWELLTNWNPAAGAWNALPPKWIRMVFFAEQNWGPSEAASIA